MTKAAVSLDYDDCSAILFKKIPEDATVEDRDRIILAKQILMDYLDNIAKTHDGLEIYVGSSRQDIFLDDYYRDEHGNGSCFENLYKLCALKGWTFRRLLLADVQNNLAPGTAMANKNIRCRFYENIKTEIVKAQVDDVSKNHPGEILDFYFFDDDPENKYMPAIKAHFENNLPNHIRKLSLVRYDSAEMVHYGRHPIMAETHLEKPKIQHKIVDKTRVIEGGKTRKIQIGLFADSKQALESKKNMAKVSGYAAKCESLVEEGENKRKRDEENILDDAGKRMKQG
jgi:hypothetical protein